MSHEQIIDTAHGPARVVAHLASQPRADVVLSHGAGRGIDGADLVQMAQTLSEHSYNAYLVEQPWVARGRKVADRPAVLDACLATVLGVLVLPGPLVLAGRSAGSRSSFRLARDHHAVAAFAMAFPLHPLGRPENTRVSELLEAGVPTLVIQGERDQMGRPAEFPTGTNMVVVPGADHGYRVPKSAAMTQQEVYSFVADTAVVWLDRELS